MTTYRRNAYYFLVPFIVIPIWITMRLSEGVADMHPLRWRMYALMAIGWIGMCTKIFQPYARIDGRTLIIYNKFIGSTAIDLDTLTAGHIVIETWTITIGSCVVDLRNIRKGDRDLFADKMEMIRASLTISFGTEV